MRVSAESNGWLIGPGCWQRFLCVADLGGRAGKAQSESGALNPRQTIYEAVAEGLRIHGLSEGEEAAVAEALSTSGLRPPERFFPLYPYEVSGGQRQRVVIAGAMALDPWLIVADEPVSSLDASVRGEILALMLRLVREKGVTILVVTHDLGLAWNIADRVAVMYLGRIVEQDDGGAATTAAPYTRAALRRARDRPHGAADPVGRGLTRRADPPAAASTRAARSSRRGDRSGSIEALCRADDPRCARCRTARRARARRRSPRRPLGFGEPARIVRSEARCRLKAARVVSAPSSCTSSSRRRGRLAVRAELEPGLRRTSARPRDPA
jgi:energy-coupling factor transporter ATP-binding protein EcfA2